MPEPIKVYNIGEKGVNLTDSPIHLTDGELVQGQNAEFYREQGRGGLRKRPALTRHNSSVLAGTVGGMIGVPLEGPGRRSVYSRSVSIAPWFKTSTDGTTWANGEGFVTAPSEGGTAYTYPMGLSVTIGRQFFYSALHSDLSTGLILGYDKIAEYELVRIPSVSTGRMTVLCQHQGSIVFTARDATSGDNAVYLLNPTTGELTLLGDFISAPEEVLCAVSYLGKVWIGTATGTTGKIYSTRVGETSWTAERTAAANQKSYQSMMVRAGILYAGTCAVGGATAAIVEARTVAGVWSTSRTGSTTTANNRYHGMAIYGTDLYVAYGDGSTTHIEKYNGTAWSVDKDLDAESPAITGVVGVVVVGSSLYYNTVATTDSHIYRKFNNAWAKVNTTSSFTQAGIMGVI